MSSAETTYVRVTGLPFSLFRYVIFVRIESGRLSVDGGGVCRSRLLGLGGGFPPVHMYSSQPLGSSSAISASSLSSCHASNLLHTRCKPLHASIDVPKISSRPTCATLTVSVSERAPSVPATEVEATEDDR